MNMKIVVLVLTLIGSINLRLEDKWYGGWKKYLKGWVWMWIHLYAIFGFITWLFNIQLYGGIKTQINISTMYLVAIFLINGIFSSLEQSDERDNERGSFCTSNYSKMPLNITLLSAIGFVLYVISVLIYIGIRYFHN